MGYSRADLQHTLPRAITSCTWKISTYISWKLGPLLLIWINSNPTMVKCVLYYLSIPKRQRLHHCDLGMNKLVHPTRYDGYNYLFFFGLKLISIRYVRRRALIYTLKPKIVTDDVAAIVVTGGTWCYYDNLWVVAFSGNFSIEKKSMKRLLHKAVSNFGVKLSRVGNCWLLSSSFITDVFSNQNRLNSHFWLHFFFS